MKSYTSFENIEMDLKRLRLEREIAWEELKLVKGEVKNDLKPANWVRIILKLVGNYSFIAVVRKITSKY
jgi:hypothetical protein